MAAPSKSQILDKIHPPLAKRYKLGPREAKMSVLEAVLYGICHEGTTREQANQAIARAQEMATGRIVTTIEEYSIWYPAENYHQDYWEGDGQRNPYCMAVIPPKLQKLRKSFAARSKAVTA